MKNFRNDIAAFTANRATGEKETHIKNCVDFLNSHHTIGTWEMDDRLEANRFRDNISAWAKAQGYWVVDPETKKIIQKTVVDVATKTQDGVTYGQLVKLVPTE